MSFETEVKVSVLADPAYTYEVVVGEYISVAVNNHGAMGAKVYFDSIEELKAVAEAMLKVVKLVESKP